MLFRTFNNAHNGYGSFVDLEAATLDDAAGFFERYYAPANAVLAVVGDADPDTVRRLVELHFGSVPGRTVPPRPSWWEPLPDGERRAVHHDELAPAPAVAIASRVPDPVDAMDEYVPTVVLAHVLAGGEASRLHQRLVKRDRLATHVSGSVSLFDAPFDVRDPTVLSVVALSTRIGSFSGDSSAAKYTQHTDRDAGSFSQPPSSRAAAGPSVATTTAFAVSTSPPCSTAPLVSGLPERILPVMPG